MMQSKEYEVFDQEGCIHCSHAREHKFNWQDVWNASKFLHF